MSALEPFWSRRLESDAAPARPYATALIVGCALFMQMLDTTIVATALPSIAASFDTSAVGLSMVIASYLLTLAAFTPLSGWIADRYGARRVFMIAVAAFVLSSLACGLAHSLPALVAARLMQGVAGALMTPVGRVLVVRNAPKTRLVDAMAYLAIPALVAPLLGPVIGGFLTVHASWRWIFLINAPIGLGTIFLAAAIMKRDPATPAKALDVRGACYCCVGLASLIFGLEAASHPTFPRIGAIAALLGGVGCGALYMIHARSHPQPVLNLALLKIRTFALGMLGAKLCSLTSGALPFLLALKLQVGIGMNALQAGTIVMATAAGSIVVKFVVSRLLGRWGFKRLLIANGICGGMLIASCALFDASTAHTVMPVALFGIGFLRSLQLTAANSLCYADLPDGAVAQASSLASTAQYVAVATGVGLAALCVQGSMLANGTLVMTTRDVNAGFIAMGMVFMVSAGWFSRLPRDAGATLLAHRVDKTAENLPR